MAQTNDSTVLISGSNRGIGLAFAQAYAEAGWNVIATSRSPENAEDLKALAAQLLPIAARGNLKVATNLNYPRFTSITYADFAAFILEQLESDEFIDQATALYSDEEF